MLFKFPLQTLAFSTVYFTENFSFCVSEYVLVTPHANASFSDTEDVGIEILKHKVWTIFPRNQKMLQAC